MKKCFLFLLLAVLWISLSSITQGVALLNITDRHASSRIYDSKVFSARHALTVAGVPWTQTQNVGEAIEYRIILASSKIRNSTFNEQDIALLASFVSSGGILICPNIAQDALLPVFGVTPGSVSTGRYSFGWNVDGGDPSLVWVDTPEETTISLGNPDSLLAVESTSFIPTGAEPLAWYDDGSLAISCHQHGAGYAYTFGVSFKDWILRNQQDKDYWAETQYAGGFDPDADMLPLWIRGIYQKHLPFAPYLSTAPTMYNNVLMVTHDIDAASNFEQMNDFADLEILYNVRATYFITTHQFSDWADGDYYTPSIGYFQELITRNMEIGSHSYGHFDDFDDESHFPLGSQSVTIDTYSPFFDGNRTYDGTVYGETKVSRDIIQRDSGIIPRCFRSGHLAFNDRLADALDSLGYKYDSSRSANDVMSNFPFILRYENDFGGTISQVLEIPMTISDVGYADSTSQQMLSNWQSIIQRNGGNHAPTNLLIHPNRPWKLQRLQNLLEWLPGSIKVMTVNEYGTFWNNRTRFQFSSTIVDSVLNILIDPASLSLYGDDQTLIIPEGRHLEELVVAATNGTILSYDSEPRGEDLLLFNFSSTGEHYPPDTPIPALTYSGYNALLSWDEVTTTVAGTAIDIDYYLVFNSLSPNGPFLLHGYTMDTSYIHLGVLLVNQQQFYSIVAVWDPEFDARGFPNDVHSGMTMEQVRVILRK